jgi:hypothetical protein
MSSAVALALGSDVEVELHDWTFGHEHALDAAAQRGKAQRDDWSA